MGSFVPSRYDQKWKIVVGNPSYRDEKHPITHKCNIWDVVTISDTQVIYLCAICKRKVAISDKDVFGIDIIALIDLGDDGRKIYPDKEQRNIKKENLEDWK